MNEQVVERSTESSPSAPRAGPSAPAPPTDVTPTPESRRRDLALAAVRGAVGDDLVLRSDREGLALLGIEQDSPLLADVLRWQGSVLLDRGETATAEALYRRSLDVAQQFNYLVGESHAVNCLGAIAQRRGELRRANQLFLAAQRMAEGCADGQLVGIVQQNLGVVADIAGNTDAALLHYTNSLRSFESTDDTRAMTLVLNNLGLLYCKAERYDEARGSYDRASALARLRDDLFSEGVIAENVAELEMARGDLKAAGRSIARVLEIAALRGDPLRRAAGLKLLGISLRMGGRGKEAVEPLSSAFALSEGAQDALLSGEILYECGQALSDAGEGRRARDSWIRALQRFEQIGAVGWVNRIRAALGD